MPDHQFIKSSCGLQYFNRKPATHMQVSQNNLCTLFCFLSMELRFIWVNTKEESVQCFVPGYGLCNAKKRCVHSRSKTRHAWHEVEGDNKRETQVGVKYSLMLKLSQAWPWCHTVAMFFTHFGKVWHRMFPATKGPAKVWAGLNSFAVPECLPFNTLNDCTKPQACKLQCDMKLTSNFKTHHNVLIL